MILGNPPIIFAEGRCVGGSTVINGGMSWRTPERVLEHWERELGLAGTGPRAMEPYFDEAERILHVEPNHEDTFGRNTQLFVEGAAALGWPVARAPRNMRRCVGLNNCALGCPTGAKQSMLVTEVPRALAAGAALADARARRPRAAGAARAPSACAAGCSATTAGRARRFEVRAPLVVLAAGARHTPGILQAQPAARARDRARPAHASRTPSASASSTSASIRGSARTRRSTSTTSCDDGILIGYAAVPPGLLAAALPGLGPEHAEKMALYNHMLTAATLVDDETEGRVVLGPDRQPYMVQTLDAADVERLHRGVALTAELLFAAGARSVLLPFADLPALTGPDELPRIDARPRVARDHRADDGAHHGHGAHGARSRARRDRRRAARVHGVARPGRRRRQRAAVVDRREPAGDHRRAGAAQRGALARAAGARLAPSSPVSWRTLTERRGLSGADVPFGIDVGAGVGELDDGAHRAGGGRRTDLHAPRPRLGVRRLS